jgi:hypothetical protein
MAAITPKLVRVGLHGLAGQLSRGDPSMLGPFQACRGEESRIVGWLYRQERPIRIAGVPKFASRK